MIKKHTFEVVVEIDGKPQIEGIYQDDRIAIARAEYLLGLARYAAVRVSRIDGRGRNEVVFEKTYSGVTVHSPGTRPRRIDSPIGSSGLASWQTPGFAIQLMDEVQAADRAFAHEPRRL